MGDATFYMLQGDEVQISALKEYVPYRHVCVSHLFSHLGLQNCNAVQNTPMPPTHPLKEYSG